MQIRILIDSISYFCPFVHRLEKITAKDPAAAHRHFSLTRGSSSAKISSSKSPSGHCMGQLLIRSLCFILFPPVIKTLNRIVYAAGTFNLTAPQVFFHRPLTSHPQSDIILISK
jgi:hypothetical protein